MILALLLPRLALAEGTAEFGTTQRLDVTTRIYVDILDYTTETITWEGDGDLEVRTPDGIFYDTYSPGDTFSVTSDGAWIADPAEREDNWDLTVNGATAGLGRIWSLAWYIDAGNFSSANSFNSSFYAVVEGGGAGYDGVVEMKTDGFAGYIFVLLANSEGVTGANGRSVPLTFSGSLTAEYPVYLNPPENAYYNTLSPTVAGETWSAGVTGCDEAAYGLVDGEFTFTASLDGTYHIVCDLNGDGAYDITSDDDLQLLGDATSGSNTVTWDGTDNAGDPVDPGTYSCEIILTVGEFHYVGADVETSYDGFRLFSLDSSLNRSGLDMYWNDAAVQVNEDGAMPNGSTSLESSGAGGVASGTYGSATVANTNARSWGDFSSNTKGNEAWLDTYTWIDEDITSEFTIVVADPTLDTDGDGLFDAEEDCTYATDSRDPDTDGDGLDDYAEVIELPTDALDPDSDGDGVVDGDECGSDPGCEDTDSDGTIDPVDDDDDGDGIATADEDLDGDGDPTNDDTDRDGTPNYLDQDDDGDTVPTAGEDTDGDNDPSDDDWDGDGTPNWLDTDDDGDGALTAEEDVDDDGDPQDDDSDADGTPDWLDTDDDADGILSEDEDADGDGSPVDDDADGDGVPNYLDPDSDEDGIPDVLEGSEDTDGDGSGDYIDTDADDDGIPDATEGIVDNDGDGSSDFHDTDDDGDGILTSEEGTVDTDGDGKDDHLDADDDDDGIPTATEGGFDTDTDGDGTSDHHDEDSDADDIPDSSERTDDPDGDGVGNWRDTDSDADTVPDKDEGTVDSDADGLQDWLDDDDDNDTVPTKDEVGMDTDGDGAPDHLDPDDDGDGILTSHENDLAWDDDVDGDGTPNWRDLDADGDEIPDADEGEGDTDGDVTPNYLDPDGLYEAWYKGGCGGCSSPGDAVGFAPLALGLLALRRRRA